jgi:hypothetical protein
VKADLALFSDVRQAKLLISPGVFFIEPADERLNIRSYTLQTPGENRCDAARFVPVPQAKRIVQANGIQKAIRRRKFFGSLKRIFKAVSKNRGKLRPAYGKRVCLLWI